MDTVGSAISSVLPTSLVSSVSSFFGSEEKPEGETGSDESAAKPPPQTFEEHMTQWINSVSVPDSVVQGDETVHWDFVTNQRQLWTNAVRPLFGAPDYVDLQLFRVRLLKRLKDLKAAALKSKEAKVLSVSSEVSASNPTSILGGIWDSIKEGAGSVVDAATPAIASATESVGDTASGILSSVGSFFGMGDSASSKPTTTDAIDNSLPLSDIESAMLSQKTGGVDGVSDFSSINGQISNTISTNTNDSLPQSLGVGSNLIRQNNSEEITNKAYSSADLSGNTNQQTDLANTSSVASFFSNTGLSSFFGGDTLSNVASTGVSNIDQAMPSPGIAPVSSTSVLGGIGVGGSAASAPGVGSPAPLPLTSPLVNPYHKDVSTVEPAAISTLLSSISSLSTISNKSESSTFGSLSQKDGPSPVEGVTRPSTRMSPVLAEASNANNLIMSEPSSKASKQSEQEGPTMSSGSSGATAPIASDRKETSSAGPQRKTSIDDPLLMMAALELF